MMACAGAHPRRAGVWSGNCAPATISPPRIPHLTASSPRMPCQRLADFLTTLRDQGDLVRIRGEVDPVHELAAITDHFRRSHADGGPALLFENVKGCGVPVAANLLGSARRICQAIGAASFDEAAQRLVAVVTPDVPEGWAASLKLLPKLSQLASVPPRAVKSGACQQVVKLGSDVNLGELPIPHCWPAESARTLTAALVCVRDRETGARHVGRYPLQIADRNTLVIHWGLHDAPHSILQQHVVAQQQMPVAVVLGGDPALTCAASLPVPPGIDAFLLTGLLHGQGIDVVRGRSIELEVPAEAEFVLEGYIAPVDAAAGCGSAATSQGFILERAGLPLLRVTALTHRANPVLPVVVPSSPPSEEHALNKLAERLLLPFLRFYLPEIVDINLPACAGASRLLFASIRKRYPRQARAVMQALWSLRPLLTVKAIVVVDADVDVQHDEQVWFAVAAHLDAARDVTVCDGPADAGDHAAPTPAVGGKLGLDATRKGPDEGARGASPPLAAAPIEQRAQLAARCRELGLDLPPAAVGPA